MESVSEVYQITTNREKAKEIASRVIKRGNQTGERFGDILQEEIDKINKKEAIVNTGK